jgi:hypothetical protein
MRPVPRIELARERLQAGTLVIDDKNHRLRHGGTPAPTITRARDAP